MAQELLNGNLPYINLYEFKPPVAFLFYGVFIYLFGKTILAVRIGGLICIFLAACFIYETGRNMYHKRAALWGSLFFIIFSMTLDPGSLGATQTEHFALLPISCMLFLLLARKRTDVNIFLIGFSLSIGVLIRSNLAYLVLGVSLIIIVETFIKEKNRLIKTFLIFGAGLFLLPLSIACIYVYQGYLDVLIKATIIAPLAFASEYDYSMSQRFSNFFSLIVKSFYSENFLIWITVICGLCIGSLKKFKEYRKLIWFLVFLFISVSLSIVQTGHTYYHYLIQLIPFMVLLTAFFLSFLFNKKIWGISVILVLLLLYPLKPVIASYSAMLRSDYGLRLYQYDNGNQVIDYLNRKGVSGKYLFFLQYHIGYWLTGAKLPTKFVHPSNIVRISYLHSMGDHNATPERELKGIFSKEPAFIIVPQYIWYFDLNCQRCFHILQMELEDNYTVDKIIGRTIIFERRKGDNGLL